MLFADRKIMKTFLILLIKAHVYQYNWRCARILQIHPLQILKSEMNCNQLHITQVNEVYSASLTHQLNSPSIPSRVFYGLR